MPVVVTLHDLFTTCPRFFRIPHPSVTSCPQPGDLDPCVRCVAPDAGGMTPAALEAGLSTRNQAFAAELAAAAAIVVPSRTQRDRIAALTALDARRLHVIPHGLVGTIAPPGAGAPSVRAADGNLRILHLGHRAEVKGTLDLVQAISALEGGERSRVCLLLLGAEVEPGFDDRLRDAAQGVQLEFLGSYDRGALSEILSMSGGADLVALPSRAHESYGLVTDEALALGLPVWVSDRGAPAERVGAAGRVLPAAEPRAWTRALREVLLDPGILAAERAAVPERLPTAADAALKLLDLYPMLLGQDPETQP